jgi:hypothetical protein
MSHPRMPLEGSRDPQGLAVPWPDSQLPADQLNSLEQLLESFGQTPPIVSALADGLADLRSQRHEMDADCKQRFDALWDVVVTHAMQARFAKATAERRRQ